MTRLSVVCVLSTLLLVPLGLLAAEEGKVSLPLAIWEQHLSEIEDWAKPEQAPIPVSTVLREIAGVFRKGLFHGELTANFEVFDTKGHIRVPVLDGSASLGEVRLNGKRTSLLREGNMYTLGVDQPGTYRVTLKFFWGREQDRFARRLRFRLPDAGATSLSVLVPEKNIEARLSNGALVSKKTVSEGTLLKGNLDASGLLDLSWTRKLTHKAKETVRSEARVNVLFTIHEALVSGVAVFDVTILEGETDRIDLKVPEEIEVVKVEGKAVLQWLTEPEGGLTVLLRYLVEDRARVAVHFQYPIETGKPVVLRTPLTPEGTAMSGALGVQAPAGLDVRVATTESAEALRDLPSELTDLTASPLLFGYGFNAPPDIQLSVSRHQQVELTSTLIDEIQASSVLIEDGTEVTKLKVRMRNNTEQYLTMHLPKGALLTHSLIDGRPIRPAVSQDEAGESLLFPLRQSERIGAEGERYHTVREGETLSDISNFYYAEPGRWKDIMEYNGDQLADERDVLQGQVLRIPAKKGLVVEESSFVIELAYKRKRTGLGNWGRIKLTLPSMNVATMKVIWHLYFPVALTPLSFGGNLTQYSFIRYDPFRRIRKFLDKAWGTNWAWAGGRYKSILKQRKVIYQLEADRKGRGDVVLAAFPLTGERYRFKRVLLEQETPTISVTYVASGFALAIQWAAFLAAFVLGLVLLGTGSQRRTWIVAGVILVVLLFLAHFFLGVHRRLVWGVDLALLVALFRLRAGPLWRGFVEMLHSPWKVAQVLTFRNLAFVVGLAVIAWMVLQFPLLLSTFAAIVMFFWWRRKASQAAREVTHA